MIDIRTRFEWDLNIANIEFIANGILVHCDWKSVSKRGICNLLSFTTKKFNWNGVYSIQISAIISWKCWLRYVWFSRAAFYPIFETQRIILKASSTIKCQKIKLLECGHACACMRVFSLLFFSSVCDMYPMLTSIVLQVRLRDTHL